MIQGFDEELEEKEEDEKVVSLEDKKKRRPFAYWEVGGKTYKMKLTTQNICRLEDKFKTSLLNVLFGAGSVPPLSVMLTITQVAMLPYNHKIKYEDVQALFDKYCEEGGTQMIFMTDVFMEIYKVSGFFTEDQAEEMDRRLEEAKVQM
ncbi:DUF6096 family protein [Hungatella hathewayi]|uniref:DUF6096 family protein n=1 Tax=Hungatella hathewayi TaxID=154046 RepID=UPI0035696576